MRWVYSDAGKSMSVRPRQSRDCTVRALATCLVLPYDASYEALAKCGRKTHRAFDLEACARKTIFPGGTFFRLHKMGFLKGERYGEPRATRRYRLEDFCHDNPVGRFIVGTASHVMAVVDGNPHDDVPYHFNENRPVYSWLVPLGTKGSPLWQAYALRPPIKGKRMVRRSVGIVPGKSYGVALKKAGEFYEWALRKGEDLDVEAIDGPE